MIEKNEVLINKIERIIELEYDKLQINTKPSSLENEFHITIGRTPPRSEKEWFSDLSSDIKWVSIKDMGENPLFIYDTNEKLIKKAITKFNFTFAEKNDILMSFKLTVGKVSFAGTNLITNEAIATFKPKKEYLRWYLYCYLKKCDFANAGSTSSIATAINSSILKKYYFPLPTPESLSDFNDKVIIYFKIVDDLIVKNRKLISIKSQLLYKYFN